jgi:hypothetical protein
LNRINISNPYFYNKLAGENFVAETMRTNWVQS